MKRNSLLLSSLAATLLGCAPGEQVGGVSFDDKYDVPKTITVTVAKGDTLHLWEDFAWRHRSEGKRVFTSSRCFRWEIRISQKGKEVEKLSCWAAYGSRCTQRSRGGGGDSGDNCKLEDCGVDMNKINPGKVTLSAELADVGNCPITMKSYALRLYRQKR